jgi:hypothetical protein
MKTIFLVILLTFAIIIPNYAQQSDSTSKVGVKPLKIKKNNIKLNLTSFLLYRPGCILTYERVIAKNQTLSLIGGYVESPTLIKIESDKLGLKQNLKKSGYMMGAEYRFYIGRENKFPAPHGVYIGPFLTYYHFHNERTVFQTNDINQSELNLVTNINIVNAGVQLGYQFVVAKRFAIDLVMFGPALSWYDFDIQLKGNISESDLNSNQQAIYDKIQENMPIVGDLLAGKQLSNNGRANTFAGGFRYAIQVGFVF